MVTPFVETTIPAEVPNILKSQLPPLLFFLTVTGGDDLISRYCSVAIPKYICCVYV